MKLTMEDGSSEYVSGLIEERRKLRAALLAVMREWNRDVEYATVPTQEWRQAEDALGRKIAPRDLKTLVQEAEVVPIRKAR